MLFHFVERKWWYFLFSALLIVPGVFFLAIGGLRPGIEFKGGTLLEIQFATRPEDSQVKTFFTSHGHDEATIQGVAGGGVEVRTTEMLPQELVSTEQDLKTTFGPDTKIVNSIGISILIEIIEKMMDRGGKIGFCCLTPVIHKTFQIMGLANYAAIFDTEEAAVKEMQLS